MEDNYISTTIVEQLSDDDEIYQIFDKIFKKIITLSSVAVINLINALFHTDYSSDSTVTYNWTEFEDDKLKRILADTILTINGQYSYHMEAQMERDNRIVFRVFEYGFRHAERNRITENGRYTLPFPEPVVIYLYHEGNVPDEYVLNLEFQNAATYEYKVPVLKLQDLSAQELNERKMVILIPFHLLKLRKAIRDGKLTENLSELKSMIENDIIGSIETNERMGNITTEDAFKLKHYLDKLWRYLLKHHKELEAFGDMTDESFMTEADIICERLHEVEDLLQEKDEALQEKDEALQEKDEMLQEKEEEIRKLKAQLEKLSAHI